MRPQDPRAPLPTSIYHPDPIATESMERSDTVCVVCRQARGYIYTGPVYAEGKYDDQICPWCIADGSAHSLLGAEFTDRAGIGGYGDWVDVPESILDIVTYRTPGFTPWQSQLWFTHCNDAAAYLGRAGYKELEKLGPEAIDAIRESDEDREDEEWQDIYRDLDKDGSPCAYLFRCVHCGAWGGYWDID